MALVYCSQGHANVSSHHFCSTCGEKLVTGSLLGNRYQIVQELGHGGFGRTYLAQDRNRFDEACVLKEFAPQVQGSEALQKAEELFAREAGVLYSLQHPQIPRFRELFRADWEGRDRLFLVQDYVSGSTYQQLREARRLENRTFSEAEGQRLLAQLLPVLDYIHRAGVVHRDISPENLIERSSDRLPVLIDFGGVKQIAATATKKYIQQSKPPLPEAVARSASVTRLGKVGYAPLEQIELGQVSPHSDLYALAVTVLVLCSGQEPQALIDPTGRSDPWQTQLPLSPEFTAILKRMLSHRSDQFSSAVEVLQALQALPSGIAGSSGTTLPPIASQSPIPAYPGSYAGSNAGLNVGLSAPDPSSPLTAALTTPTQPIAPLATGQPIATSGTQSVSPVGRSSRWQPLWQPLMRALPIGLVMACLIGLGWWSRPWWQPLLSQPWSLPLSPQPDAPSTPTPTPSALSPLEQAAEAAGIDYGFLVQLTDASFRSRYPDQSDRTLSDGPEDAEWRRLWAELADTWLTQLPQILSESARQKLGRYSEADRQQWQQAINQRYVGSRSLDDLTDAQFFHWFPEQRDQSFMQQPIGQIWQAIAADQVTALIEGETLEEIRFAEGAFSDQVDYTLEPGAGRVYIANLAAEQILRLNLQVPPDRSRLSLYLPRPTADQPFLLADADQTTWVGTLPQSGYYEIVVVNTGTQPIRYQLTLAVDNVSSRPVTPSPGDTPAAKEEEADRSDRTDR